MKQPLPGQSIEECVHVGCGTFVRELFLDCSDQVDGGAPVAQFHDCGACFVQYENSFREDHVMFTAQVVPAVARVPREDRSIELSV